MTLMLRLLPASLFRRIKPPPRRLTLLSWRAPTCAIVAACVAASCGEDSDPSTTTDMTIATTDTSAVPTTPDTTVDTTATSTTAVTSSDTTVNPTGTTTTADTTGTAGMGTTVDTTVDTGMPTTTATTSDTTGDTAGPTTTADSTMVEPSTDGTSDMTTDTTDSATPLLTFAEIDRLILIPSCVNVICHSGPPYFDPVLGKASDGLHNTLMTWTVEECDNQPLVVPGDPDNSALLMLVRRECDPIVVESTGEMFESMPPFCEDPICLPQADYDALVAWINAGAPE